MKSFKQMILLFILLLPATTQAGTNSLLYKLEKVWYDKVMTIMFDFEHNILFMASGVNEYTIPISNIKPMANVLFFTDSLDHNISVTLINDDMIQYNQPTFNKPITLFRWKFDVKIPDFFQGGWYNISGTFIFDFNKKKETMISGAKVFTTDIEKFTTFANTVFYYHSDTKYAIHYVNDEMITWFSGNITDRYGTFFRWKEN